MNKEYRGHNVEKLARCRNGHFLKQSNISPGNTIDRVKCGVCGWQALWRDSERVTAQAD